MLALASTCAVPKLPTLALPLMFMVPVTLRVWAGAMLAIPTLPLAATVILTEPLAATVTSLFAATLTLLLPFNICVASTLNAAPLANL